MPLDPKSKIPDLSVVIPSHGRTDLIHDCIQSVYQTKGDLEVQIIVVNDGAPHEPYEALQNKYPEIELIRNRKNLGSSVSFNAGARLVRSEIIVFLNCDTQVCSGTLQIIKNAFDQNPSLACVGCHELSPEGKTRTTWRDRHTLKSAISHMTGYRIFKKEGRRHQVLDWDRAEDRWMNNLNGFAFSIKKRVFDQIEGFDEQIRFYFEDNDLAIRLEKSGHLILYLGKAKVIHLGGGGSAFLGEWALRMDWVEGFLYTRQKHGLSRGMFLERMCVYPFAVVWWFRRIVRASVNRIKA